MGLSVNERFAKPFAETFISTLEMMADIAVVAEPIFVKGEESTPGDVSGVIGLAGREIMGSVALKFPETLILRVYSAMMGAEATEASIEVCETAAELANIVAGGAKTALAPMGLHFNLTIPSVAIGKNHTLYYGTDSKVIVVPFKIEGQSVYMEILLKKGQA